MILKHFGLALLISLSALTVWGRQSVVPKEISEPPDFRLASDFLKRYMDLLYQPTSIETSDILRRTKEDGFTYTIGNDTRLKNLSGNEDFSILFNDDCYKVAWSKDDIKLVECIIPANIGLLTFSNKVELENALIQRLLTRQDSEARERPMALKENLEKVIGSNFYVKDGGYHIIPRLSNRIVYAHNPVDTTEICSMLIDSNRYKLESIANILLSGYSPFPIYATVKVSQYGYNSQTVSIPFHILFNTLSSDNSIPYWGVETFDGTTVKGLYVWTNKYGGYNHLLTVTIPVNVLTEPSHIEATLHCYIRTDNLKSLFDEYPQL